MRKRRNIATSVSAFTVTATVAVAVVVTAVATIIGEVRHEFDFGDAVPTQRPVGEVQDERGDAPEEQLRVVQASKDEEGEEEQPAQDGQGGRGGHEWR